MLDDPKFKYYELGYAIKQFSFNILLRDSYGMLQAKNHEFELHLGTPTFGGHCARQNDRRKHLTLSFSSLSGCCQYVYSVIIGTK